MYQIQQHIRAITELCVKHRVKSLFAFGSVTRNELKPQSDIDLLVDIDADDPLDYSDNYFGLKMHLEKLLGRKVELLEQRALNNKFLNKYIDDTKVIIYGKGY